MILFYVFQTQRKPNPGLALQHHAPLHHGHDIVGHAVCCGPDNSGLFFLKFEYRDACSDLPAVGKLYHMLIKQFRRRAERLKIIEIEILHTSFEKNFRNDLINLA